MILNDLFVIRQEKVPNGKNLVINGDNLLFNQPYQLKNYNFANFPNPKLNKAGYNRFFRKGDILFLTIRSNKKIWLADQEGVCNTSIQVLIPNQKIIYPQFLISILVSENMTKWIEHCSQGSTFPSIIWNTFIQKPVNIPSLEKQKAIIHHLGDLRQKLIKTEKKIQELENLLIPSVI